MLSIIYILTAINLIVILSAALLLLLSSRTEQVSEERNDYYIQEAKKRSDSLLYRAMTDANRILAEAELEGIKAVARDKLEGKKLEERFEQQISELAVELVNRLQHSANQADKRYQRLILELEQTLVTAIDKQQAFLKGKAAEFFHDSEEKMDSFVAETQKQLREQLDRQLAGTKNAVEEYRRQRMKIVDERIIDILTDTMKATIGETFSLEQQKELVFKALQKAKKEQVFEEMN